MVDILCIFIFGYNFISKSNYNITLNLEALILNFTIINNGNNTIKNYH